MVSIPLGHGIFAQVDDCDVDLLWNHEWCFHVQGSYACRRENKIRIFLHHVIAKRMGLDPSLQVDHKDRHGLNCCRSNIRQATQAQNLQNKSLYKNSSSGFKGVIYYPHLRAYGARIQLDKKRMFLGSRSTAEEAAKLYDRAAKKLFGEFAACNFLEEKSSAT